MGQLFDPNSMAMKFLTRVYDMMILNIVFIVCSLPIVTIGASMTALHYILLRMARDEERYIVKDFLKAFRENFRQSTISFCVLLLSAGGIISGGSRLLFVAGIRGMVSAAAVVLLAVVWMLLYLYVFVLTARFENTVAQTFDNAIRLGAANLPRTVSMMIVVVAFAILYYSLPVGMMIPLVFLFGFTVPGYIRALLYTPILQELEPEEEFSEDMPVLQGIEAEEE